MNIRTLKITVPLAAVILLAASCGDDPVTPIDTGTADTVNDMADTGYDPTPDTTPADTTPADTMPTDTIPADTTPPDTTADTTPGNGVGESCSVTADCSGVPGAGRLCLTDLLGYLSFAGGYCSAACTSASDCGAGGECVDVYGYHYCLKVCSSAGECRTAEGYSCTTLPGGPATTYCLPPSPDPETTTDY